MELRGQWAAQPMSDHVAPLLLEFPGLLLPSPGFIHELSCSFPLAGGWPQEPKPSTTSGPFFFFFFKSFDHTFTNTTITVLNIVTI